MAPEVPEKHSPGAAEAPFLKANDASAFSVEPDSQDTPSWTELSLAYIWSTRNQAPVESCISQLLLWCLTSEELKRHHFPPFQCPESEAESPHPFQLQHIDPVSHKSFSI